MSFTPTELQHLNRTISAPSMFIEDRPDYRTYAFQGFGIYRLDDSTSGTVFTRLSNLPASTTATIIYPRWKYCDSQASETGLITLELVGWQITNAPSNSELLQKIRALFPETL